MNIALAIRSLRPNEEFVCGETYDTLDWRSSTNKPTEAEVSAEWEKIKDKYAWSEVRNQRNQLLSQTDWTQLQDSSCDKDAWALYRQALRNIPQDYATPSDVVWPNKP